MDKSLHFSSEMMTWRTPPEIFNPLHAEINFDCDICASPGSNLLPNYVSPDMDALSPIPWAAYGNRLWMNPPYGRALSKWMARTHAEWLNGLDITCLIPARTDTAYWHDYVMQADEIRFVRGRIRFLDESGQATNAAPFPSAIIRFTQTIVEHLNVVSWSP